jgi:hypothetical protein
MSSQNYRLYTFVAGLYLSELQKGLQTAHVVSEMVDNYMPMGGPACNEWVTFRDWADTDKTIIILNALNHGTVTRTFAEMAPWAKEAGLPIVLFHEDEESMNGMATACGIILPEIFWGARYVHGVNLTDGTYGLPTNPTASWVPPKYVYRSEDGTIDCTYVEGSVTFNFLQLLKSFKMA